MKLLFDLFPVILFFATFKYAEKSPELAASWMGSLLGFVPDDIKLAPILLATVVVIAATIAQIIWVHFRHGKVDKMLWVSLVLVVVFGGMTLAFQNEAFIKWKPTILYWVFAGSMAFSAFVFKKNAIRAMLGEQLTLPEPVWAETSMSALGRSWSRSASASASIAFPKARCFSCRSPTSPWSFSPAGPGSASPRWPCRRRATAT